MREKIYCRKIDEAKKILFFWQNKSEGKFGKLNDLFISVNSKIKITNQ